VFAGVLAKAVGGRMPADQETIRYTGISGVDERGQWFFSREILGGGSGGRFYADGSDTIHVVPDSQNLPAEFVESRFPLRIERLGLAPDSGGPGTYRGGLGYRKEIRALTGGTFMSIADRSILSCWGLNGGRAGQPFRVTVDPGGPGERVLEGLCDAEPIAPGEVIRIETTGGGGWGDPLDRDPAAVALDVLQGKVTAARARDDYGVVVRDGEGEGVDVDEDATVEVRAQMRAERGPAPFYDRGPGFPTLAGGATSADVDTVP
jgi:N-methylhydantoinase B